MCSDNEMENPLIQNASIQISISDVNDEEPVFNLQAYTGHVKENEVNCKVRFSPPLRATDGDSGRNAVLSYILKDIPLKKTSSENETQTIAASSSLFRIDSRSGNIWTTSALDSEVSDHYSFHVVAIDDGLPEQKSTSVIVNILVDDTNDNPPEFDQYQYNFEVNENAPSGIKIGTVIVHDADKTEINRRVQFSLRGRSEDLILVDINRSSGELSMRRSVDYEKQSSISLTVIAENELPFQQFSTLKLGVKKNQFKKVYSKHALQRYTAEASIIISIININDNRPEFVPSTSHQKFIVFIWEQLSELEASPKIHLNKNNSVENTFAVAELNSQSRQLNDQTYCEQIPYIVIDKDFDVEKQEYCCSLLLENTFDDMFGLIKEIPNVLCILKKPLHPQSYKVTLVARDGEGNESLSAQIQLTVIVKSGLDYNKLLPNSKVPDEAERLINYDVSNKHLSRLQDKYDSANTKIQDIDINEKYALTTASSHQMKIISILVAIAGIFCILLLFIIAALKCGIFDNHSTTISKTKSNIQNLNQVNAHCRMNLNSPNQELSNALHPGGDDYRTMGKCFSDEVFYVEQKYPYRYHGIRDGTYEVSPAFSSNVNNFVDNISTANDSAIKQTRNTPIQPVLSEGMETISVSNFSPKLTSSSSAKTSLEVTSLNFSNLKEKGITSKLNEGILPNSLVYVPCERLLSTIKNSNQNINFFTSSEAYQTLDPSTITTFPSLRGQNDLQNNQIELEMVPIASQDNKTFKKILKTESKQQITNENKFNQFTKSENQSNKSDKHDVVKMVYNKAGHHSSFV